MAQKAVSPPYLPQLKNSEVTSHQCQFNGEHPPRYLQKYRRAFRVRETTLSDVLVCGA
jgi:hypothetical protein